MLRPCFCALALAVAAAAAAQDIVVSVVHEDGTVAPGSAVRLESVRTGRVEQRVTGPGGVATISSRPGVRYLVTASDGARSSAPVEVAAGGPPQRLVLRFRAVREEVVVSATGAPRESTATLVATISGAELDDRGEWLLAEALRGVPGLHLRQDGGPGRIMAATVRGVPGSGTAVLVDGAPVRDAAAPQGDAASLLPTIPAMGVERVEVRRGGGSSLYGTSGMGGVIQIVTRAARPGARASFHAGLGGRGKRRAGAWFGASGEDRALSGGLTRTGFREGSTGDDRFANTGGLLRASVDFHGVRIAGRLMGSVTRFGLAESPSAIGPLPPGVVEASVATFTPDLIDPDATHRTETLAAQLSLAGAGWTLRAQELVTRREVEDGPLGPNRWDPASAETTRWDGGVRAASARLATRAGAHRFTLGGEAQQERMDTTTPLARVQARQSTLALFAQDEIRVGDRVRVRGAARMEGFSTGAPAFRPAAGSPWPRVPAPEGGLGWSGDLSAAWMVSEVVRLRGSWSRGFRAPSLYERFGTWYSSFGYSTYGDPRLAPEFTHVRDLGITVSAADGRLDAEIAWFGAARPQVIAFGPLDPASDPFGRVSGYANTSAGGARGIEAGVRAALSDGLRVRGSFTWTDADPPDNAPAELPAAWLIPAGEASVIVSGRRDRFTWSLDWHLTSERYGPMFDPTDFSTRVFRFAGMRRVDLVAGWEVTRGVRLRAQVRDALDDRAWESAGFRPLGRVVEAGVRVQF